MQVKSNGKMPVGYSLGRLKSNKKAAVIVAKASYHIETKVGEAANSLCEVQTPLFECDSYLGEPGLSAVLYENDYAPIKPFCDVLVNGTAHAPMGTTVQNLIVRLKLENIDKSFRVWGDRVWTQGGMGNVPSEAEHFSKKPIHYGLAYGGTGTRDHNENRPYAFASNPVGCGYYEHKDPDNIEGLPLPNTEELENPIESHTKKYQPMGFSPVARNFAGRYTLAGTYDNNWVENICPFWPEDFDERYHQCAPADQQMAYPKGGELVSLENLGENSLIQFTLPDTELPITVIWRDGRKQVLSPVVDTICIEPDQNRFTLVWRCHVAVKHDINELQSAIVGKMSRAWWIAETSGKKLNPHIVANQHENSDP